MTMLANGGCSTHLVAQRYLVFIASMNMSRAQEPHMALIHSSRKLKFQDGRRILRFKGICH
jgi:hypothetical protein